MFGRLWLVWFGEDRTVADAAIIVANTVIRAMRKTAFIFHSTTFDHF
jgi:hypothetical protein